MKTQTKSSLNHFRIFFAASLCQRSRRAIGGLAVLLASLLLGGWGHAADIVWTNTASGNWSSINNWSPNQVPVASDTAWITNNGTYTVTLDASATVNSLALGGTSGQQTLANSSYTLTLNQASVVNTNGLFNLSGGSLAGTGLLTIQGQFVWNGGQINAGSVLTVATSGLLVLTGGSGHYFYGILTNAGTIQLPAGGGDLQLYGSCGAAGAIGELVNLPGALVDVQGNNSIDNACGTELVINQGVVRKSGGTGTTYIYPTFTNSGTLDVQTGTVNLYNSGKGTGTFLPEAGATLIFRTSYEMDSALTGAGTNLLNGGTFTLNGNINGSNVVLNGASLLASNTVINSALTWNNSSQINAGSVLTVATNGLLVLTGGGGHNFYGILTNAGTIQLPNGGGDLVPNGSCGGGIGELINLPGALVDVRGNNSISSAGCNTELVINQGVLRKSGGTGTTYIYPSLTNSGTLDVQTGTVSLNYGQGSGVFLPEAGATLIFSKSYEVDSNLTGAGTNLLNGGTFTLNGNINGSNVVLNGASLLASNTVINSALTWNSGSQINAGSVLTVATNRLLLLTGGNWHNFYGILTNAGTIQLPAGGGNLYLNGSCNPGAIGELVNLPGALVDMQGDNVINYGCGSELVINQGVVRKSGGTGTTTIQPQFNNSGTLDIQTGTVTLNKGQGGGVFLPEAGATLIFSTTYEVDSNLTGAGTNLLNSGTFTLNGNINGSNVVLNGANLLASNTVINSALTWNSGQINAGSVLTVATNRLLLLTGGGHYFYGILTNAGTIQLASGDLNLYGSCQVAGAVGELVNLPGALVDVQGNYSINIGCGSELVLNQGMVRKSGGTGTTYIYPTFNNSGTLDVQTGTVYIYSIGQGSGLFLPEAGATLIFRDSYEMDSDLTGAGTNLLNGGTFTLNGNINGSNVVMNGANLLARNTVINSALTWNSGSILVGSVVTVATNGLLTLTSGGGHFFYGIMTNAGTIQLLNGGGDLQLDGSCQAAGAIGELINLPGALVDLQGDNSITFACDTTELIINQGVLRKSGGTGITTINPPFNNSGTVQASSGTMSFSQAFIQSAGQTVLNGGNFAFSQVAQLLGGTITGTGTITGSISNNAAIGTGSSPGLLTISGNYTESANAHLAIKLGGILAGTNYDQLSIGGSAALAGTLDISYWNGFTPSAGSFYTVLACNARTGFFSAITAPTNTTAAIYTSKTVLVEPGHVPPTAKLTVPAQSLAGHNFAVKGSGNSLDGTVTNLTLLVGTNVLVSAPGSSAQVNFSSDFPGTLTFTAVATDNEGAQGVTNATATINTLPLRTLDAVGFQTDLAFKLLMLGVAGTDYQVLASTNLAVPGWTILGTMERTNGIWRFLDTAATNSSRFYQAKQLP